MFKGNAAVAIITSINFVKEVGRVRDVYEESVARSFTDILTKPAAPETIITTVRRCVAFDRLTEVGSKEGPAA